MEKVKDCCCNEGCKCTQDLSEAQKISIIDDFINDYKSKEGSLIQILHAAQSIFGYLPIEVQIHIAKSLNKPLSEISGVVSFYSFFTTAPRGEYTIRVCMGTACYVRGGKKILDRIKDILEIEVGQTTADNKFTLELMRCIGACGLAPAISINDKVYKQVNPERLNEILTKYYE